MYRSIIAVFCFVYVLGSCHTRTASRLLEHESLFLDQFVDHSLLIRGDIIELQIYKGNLLNNYFFRKKDKELKLTRDSSQFSINELPIYREININNIEEYTRQLEEVAGQLLSKMKEANVSSFTSEFRKFGVDLMINTKDQKLLYVSDTMQVTNPEWKTFLEQSNKVKDHWYLYTVRN